MVALELLQPHLDTDGFTLDRSLALMLYRFIHGDLAGLFDGAGEPLRFSGELVVVDLSSQWSSNSLPVAVLSAVAAAQQVVGRAGELGYLVIDEAWALLGDATRFAGCRARGSSLALRGSPT